MKGAVPYRPAMRGTAIPEHPDVVRERKRERWAVLFGLGSIVIFFGVGLWVFATYAKYYYWAGREIPAEVQASIDQEFTLGYWLIGVGVAVVVASYIVWWYLRRRAERAFEI